MATSMSPGPPSKENSFSYPAASSVKLVGLTTALLASSTTATKCVSDAMSIPAKRTSVPLSDGGAREPRSRCPCSRLSMRGRLRRLSIPFEQRTPGEGVNLISEDCCLDLATTTLSRNPSDPIIHRGLPRLGVIQDPSRGAPRSGACGGLSVCTRSTTGERSSRLRFASPPVRSRFLAGTDRSRPPSPPSRPTDEEAGEPGGEAPTFPVRMGRPRPRAARSCDGGSRSA